jgi:hypothetical protein
MNDKSDILRSKLYREILKKLYSGVEEGWSTNMYWNWRAGGRL